VADQVDLVGEWDVEEDVDAVVAVVEVVWEDEGDLIFKFFAGM